MESIIWPRKTYYRYVQFLERIKPAIGHFKLKDLKPHHLNAFYRNLDEDGISKWAKRDEKGNIIKHGKLAPKTQLEHHRLISTILNTAVKWGLLEYNVALRADPPKLSHREIAYLDEEQVKRLMALLEDEPIQYRTMVTLVIFSGLRRGELCGLEWKDIDFEAGTMKVIRTSQYIGNKTFITKEPKTKSGIRELVLSKSVLHLLQQYKAHQDEQIRKVGEDWEHTDRLFTMWNGRPIHPDTISSWFTSFIDNNGFPHVTLHSLRHSHATLLIAEGVDISTVSKRLGHANTSVTLNIYTRALKSKNIEAANKLDDLLAI